MKPVPSLYQTTLARFSLLCSSFPRLARFAALRPAILSKSTSLGRFCLTRSIQSVTATATANMVDFPVAESLSQDRNLPDLIVVKQLAVRMIVGVDNWERVSPQTVTIDARIHTDVSKTGQSDHLPFSIHYGIVVKQLEAHCAVHRYKSLEALAEGLAKVCLFICHAPKVTLNVEMPRSLLHAASVGVQIVRIADDYQTAGGETASALPADADLPDLGPLLLWPNSQNAIHDKFLIRDLVINTIIGVNPWEREDKQNVKLNLVIYSGLGRAKAAKANRAALFDVVNRPHNYRTIVRSISEYVESSSYQTVESLATSIARVAALQNKVGRIRVSVDKPSAIMFASSAGVEVERSREFFLQEALNQDPAIDAAAALAKAAVPQASTPPHAGSSQEWHLAAIALGSNLGDRAANIERAVQELNKADGCVVVDTSFLYETVPMYVVDQPRFVNGACRIATTLSPQQLLDLTQSIETNLGRDKTGIPDKGPRSVDLDILLYDHLELDESPRLVIPHPAIKEREFVLEPLKDILPYFEHPVHSRTMSQLLTMLQKSPDYQPSGIRRVMPLHVHRSVRQTAGLTDTPLWSWGSKTFVMAIINATPDSFSDGGDHLHVAKAVEAASRMVQEGADLVDVGGMSTSPNAAEVSAGQEMQRVIPVIRAIRAAGLTVPISIDTFRGSVAEAALEAGADMINDVSGGERDAYILEVARNWSCPYILMHMRGDSKTMTQRTHYLDDDVVSGVRDELEQRLDRALRAGLMRWNIILDPGIGFAKDQRGNLELIRRLDSLQQTRPCPSSSSSSSFARSASRPSDTAATVALAASPASRQDGHETSSNFELISQPLATLNGFPILLGPSRKRFLGHITGKTDPKDRIYATAAACTAGIANGVDILRVHDVKEMVDVAKTSDTIYRSAQV